MPRIANEDQAEFWEGMAATWVDIEERIETMAAQPGLAAMQALGPKPGDSVIDLGCGTGGTTIALAALVKPEGSVVGADISAEMLERGRQRAQEAGVSNVRFVHADVQAEEFPEGTFDGAFSRFGVMFYTDPVKAFSNVRVALKPAGRLSFACWQQVFANEWMMVPAMAVMSVTGTPPTMPAEGEPGPFSLADPEHTTSVLERAGFKDVRVAAHNDSVVVPESELATYAETSLRIGAAREGLNDADDATRARALEAVEEAMRERASGGEIRLTRGYLVVTATA